MFGFIIEHNYMVRLGDFRPGIRGDTHIPRLQHNNEILYLTLLIDLANLCPCAYSMRHLYRDLKNRSCRREFLEICLHTYHISCRRRLHH